MKKTEVMAVIVAVLMALTVSTAGAAETARDSFAKTYPKYKFDSINPTAAKGIYEVVMGTRILYYAPESGHLFLGDMIDRNGVNITAGRIQEVLLAKANGLPLNKAIKIGNGNNIVIEFTNPDCPYCRRASDFFGKRTDTTRYVFFTPFPSYKDAENKVKYVFCASDRPKAYEEAMHGKLDSQKYEVCKRQDVDDLLKVHKEASDAMGVTGTPFFIVNKAVVRGADFPRIEAALIKPQPTKAAPAR
jgi:thiol:disulfide interchange protein DsbC